MLTCRRLVLVVAAGVMLSACEPSNQGYQPRQPIIYSHAVHAGDLQIPCQYCHFTAERGRFAGIPPAAICMNCHEQVRQDHPEIVKVATAIEAGEPISWVRVHRLPDHAYFNHGMHVAADLECQTCHGQVQEMALVRQEETLSMGWCLSCHRDQPVEFGLNPRTGRLTDCVTCHH